ncbi:hypothetical protein [uncultured Paraglaciecola sp.]
MTYIYSMKHLREEIRYGLRTDVKHRSIPVTNTAKPTEQSKLNQSQYVVLSEQINLLMLQIQVLK